MKLFESLKAGDKILCFIPFQCRMEIYTVESISISDNILIKTQSGNIAIKFGTAWLIEGNYIFYSCIESYNYYMNTINKQIKLEDGNK